MIKILCLSINYPLTMAKYFERAFRRRADVELTTVGSYTGNNIPWGGVGMTVPIKYAVPPDIVLPIPPNAGLISWDVISNMVDVDKFDLLLTIDAGCHYDKKPITDHACIAHIGTDPHVLSPWYELPRSYSDVFFNMQKVYSKPTDIWLPYASDNTVHYPIEIEKKHDAILVGMPYPKRIEWCNALRTIGVDAVIDNGPIFDEYRNQACSAPVGLNWSSMDDLNARAYELPAMRRIPVMNHVTDMDEAGFIDGENCLLFNTLEEANDKVIFAINNDAAENIAAKAYDTFKSETYDKRVQMVLERCGIIK